MYLFQSYRLSFYFLADSMSILNAKNDLNELIFLLSEGDSGKRGWP